MKGAKVNTKGGRSLQTCLHYAAKNGHTEVGKILIDHGATVNMQNKKGATPLQLAASEGHTETCNALIKARATVNVVNEKDRTPLYKAASGGHTAACLALIANGANCEIGNDDPSPLSRAAQLGFFATCLALVRKGANFLKVDYTGFSLLNHACYNFGDYETKESSELCMELIQRGADVNLEVRQPLDESDEEVDEKETVAVPLEVILVCWTMHSNVWEETISRALTIPKMPTADIQKIAYKRIVYALWALKKCGLPRDISHGILLNLRNDILMLLLPAPENRRSLNGMLRRIPVVFHSLLCTKLYEQTMSSLKEILAHTKYNTDNLESEYGKKILLNITNQLAAEDTPQVKLLN